METQLATTPTARAGDRDREKTAARLGQAFAQGYLQLDEYEQRLQAALETRSADELDKLLADLPLDRLRHSDPRRRAARAAAARAGVRIHLGAYVAMAMITLMIWAAVAVTTREFYFWPVWPVLGGAIGLFSHAMAVRSCPTTVR